MINKNIKKIRKDLDKLDILFLKLLKKRTKLVDLVLKNNPFLSYEEMTSGLIDIVLRKQK